MPSKQRLHSLDALRGIMMLLGIVLHGAASFVVYPIEALWPYKFTVTHEYFDATLTIIHLFRIPVFYIVAGYFMSMLLSKYDWKVVIKKRFNRIVIPFVLAMVFLAPIVTFCFYLLINNITVITSQDVADYLSIYYINTVHFWFLYYLIFFYTAHLLYHYLLVPRIREVKSSLKISTQFFFILAFSWQIFILTIFGNNSIHGDYSILPALGSVLYFMGYYFMGLRVFTHFKDFLAVAKFSIQKLLAAILFTTSYLIFRANEDFFSGQFYASTLESLLSILATATLILTIFGAFFKIFTKPQKWINTIAKSSYTIYMVHLPIMIWLIYFLKDTIHNPFMFYVILVGLTGGIGYLIYWGLERIRGL